MYEPFAENATGDRCTAWCRACNRFTVHRLDHVIKTSHAPKAGPCLEHGPRTELTNAQQKPREKSRQTEMFT
jgi:hypothetical protein